MSHHDEFKLTYVVAASDTTCHSSGNNRVLISRVTLGPKALVDNTLLDLQNSSYPTKAIALLFIQNISPILKESRYFALCFLLSKNGFLFLSERSLPL